MLVMLIPMKVEPNYSIQQKHKFMDIGLQQQMQVCIVTARGWNAGKAIFYNDLGEGQAYGNEYWGQARFKYKG